MNYFLVKADPDEDYSIDDLKNDGKTSWDGVHNFAAIGFIKKMEVGDSVFVYHSQKEKSVVGLARVSGKPFLNTKDPRTSWAIELEFVEKFKHKLTLADIKSEPICKDFALVKQSRLSVMPASDQVAEFILSSCRR